MKKIWIVVGVVSALTLAGCGGGEKTETKQAATAAPAGGAATPDLANGAKIVTISPAFAGFWGELTLPSWLSAAASPVRLFWKMYGSDWRTASVGPAMVPAGVTICICV